MVKIALEIPVALLPSVFSSGLGLKECDSTFIVGEVGFFIFEHCEMVCLFGSVAGGVFIRVVDIGIDHVVSGRK